MKLKALMQWPWKAIVAALLTIITANWSAEGLQGKILFEGLFYWAKDYQWLIIFIVCLTFVISFFLLIHYRETFLPVKSFTVDEVTPHRCMIIFLSSPFPKNRPKDVHIGTDQNGLVIIAVKNSKNNTVVKLPVADIKSDIEALEGTLWSWQQFLRGIEPHILKKRLEQVYLIGSPSTEGSHAVLWAAESLIKFYFKKIKTIYKHHEPIDFEDFDALFGSLYKALDIFKTEGYHEKDIIIDVTGGQKTTSIAGATMTLNKNMTFQYVQTNPDEKGNYKVLEYDVKIQTPPGTP